MAAVRSYPPDRGYKLQVLKQGYNYDLEFANNINDVILSFVIVQWNNSPVVATRRHN